MDASTTTDCSGGDGDGDGSGSGSDKDDRLEDSAVTKFTRFETWSFALVFGVVVMLVT